MDHYHSHRKCSDPSEAQSPLATTPSVDTCCSSSLLDHWGCVVREVATIADLGIVPSLIGFDCEFMLREEVLCDCAG